MKKAHLIDNLSYGISVLYHVHDIATVPVLSFESKVALYYPLVQLSLQCSPFFD